MMQYTNESHQVSETQKPTISVQPRGIGPVIDLNRNDVLSGRGGRINGHYGNIQFRQLCGERRSEYVAKTTKKAQKAFIAANIVQQVRSMNPPGRFLKQDARTGEWWDIGCAAAFKKVGQAIREHTAAKIEKEPSESTSASVLPTPFGRQTSDFQISGPLYPGYQFPNDLAMTVPQSYSSIVPCEVFGSQEQMVQTHYEDQGNHQFENLFTHDIHTPLRHAPTGGLTNLMRESVLSDVSDCSMMTAEGPSGSLALEDNAFGFIKYEQEEVTPFGSNSNDIDVSHPQRRHSGRLSILSHASGASLRSALSLFSGKSNISFKSNSIRRPRSI